MIVSREAHPAEGCGVMVWTQIFPIYINTRLVYARKSESDSSDEKMYQI